MQAYESHLAGLNEASGWRMLIRITTANANYHEYSELDGLFKTKEIFGLRFRLCMKDCNRTTRA